MALRACIQRQLYIICIGVGGGVEKEGDPSEHRIVHPAAAEFETVHHRHQHVRYDIGRLLSRRLQRLLSIAGIGHAIAALLENHLQQIAVLADILNDQYVSFIVRNRFRQGNVESAASSPLTLRSDSPHPSTRCLVMARPSPVPSYAWRSTALIRLKGWKQFVHILRFDADSGIAD